MTQPAAAEARVLRGALQDMLLGELQALADQVGVGYKEHTSADDLLGKILRERRA